MAVKKLAVVWEKRYICPNCGKKLRYVPGGAVTVVNGQVNMQSAQPTYECDNCKLAYKELLGSGYFEEGPQKEPEPDLEAFKAMAAPSQEVIAAASRARKALRQAEASRRAKPAPVRVVRTGDLQPMQLKREADGKCTCPRCGERMDFVEGQPVRIVNGKPDMDNVMDHFRCPHCGSVFRRIATTDYFQWSEK